MSKKATASESEENVVLADGGEAAAVFLHELGNVLNNLLLSNRLMQRQLPEEHASRLTESCRLVSEIAGHMQQLARYRQTQRIAPYPVDVNGLVHQLADEQGESIHLEGDQEPALVQATAADLRRLLRLLVQNALAVSEKKPIRVELQRDAQQVRLSIEDNGPPVRDDQLPLLFEPFQQPLRPGQSQLELAVCRNVVRRQGGQLEAAKTPGGLRWTVTWPAAKADR